MKHDGGYGGLSRAHLSLQKAGHGHVFLNVRRNLIDHTSLSTGQRERLRVRESAECLVGTRNWRRAIFLRTPSALEDHKLNSEQLVERQAPTCCFKGRLVGWQVNCRDGLLPRLKAQLRSNSRRQRVFRCGHERSHCPSYE